MANLLSINDLTVEYTVKQVFSQDESVVHAVNGLSLDVNEGEILAIAGESGCGKSTLAKAIMRLIDVKSGSIIFDTKDILKFENHKDLKSYYQNAQIVFQNPYSSLNPKMSVKKILAEPLEINTSLSKSEINSRIDEKIAAVGLDKSVLDMYPHEFSGGQRQRIAIARALVLNPKFIVADEPVSALDVSIQAQIVNLIRQLRNNYNITFIFISHDLSVIRYIADKVAIMYLGEIIEFGRTNEVFQNPMHPYTQALLSAVPSLNKNSLDEKVPISGELPSVSNLPNGCKFNTRCSKVMEVCKKCTPDKQFFTSTHSCKCFLYDSVI